jgi:copper oxidase (laccase) domain-containing protein
MASLKQIHSARALAVEQAGCAGEGDALVSCSPGLLVSVRSADCYPVLLADTKHRAVAAVHAGWRGTAGRVVLETVAKMRDQFDLAADIVAAIGLESASVAMRSALRWAGFSAEGAGTLTAGQPASTDRRWCR